MYFFLISYDIHLRHIFSRTNWICFLRKISNNAIISFRYPIACMRVIYYTRTSIRRKIHVRKLLHFVREVVSLILAHRKRAGRDEERAKRPFDGKQIGADGYYISGERLSFFFWRRFIRKFISERWFLVRVWLGAGS